MFFKVTFLFFVLSLFECKAQSIFIESKEMKYDTLNNLINIRLNLTQIILKDTVVFEEKKEIEHLENHFFQFQLTKFGFFNYERLLLLSNNDIIKYESDYERAIFHTRGKAKKYKIKAGSNIFYYVNLFNSILLKQILIEYNQDKNEQVSAKKIILKIYTRKNKIPVIEYYYDF